MKLISVAENMFATSYWREASIVNHFSSFLPGNGRIVDIGAGSGKLAQYFVNTTELHVEMVDVVDHNVTAQPMTLYDGQRLPYDDDSFEACMLVFVLHHAADSDGLIREAARISKRRLIIVEDTPANRWERIAWSKWDYYLNHAHHEDIAVAHTAHSPEEWHRIFTSHELKVTAEKQFRTMVPVLGMYRHTAFVLDKNLAH